MSAFDWLLLALCIHLLGKVISIKVMIKLDVIALLKHWGERKKGR